MATDQPPVVSICIPAYNQTSLLKILLTSIAEQTFSDYEIIVSDDSTTTDVKVLIEDFGFGNKLKYYRNKPALGSPRNWNAAISKAAGKYIKIMHHDDALNSPTTLEEMIRCLEANSYDYVFSWSAIENVNDPGQNRIHQIKRFDRLLKKPFRLFFGNSIGGPSCLVTTKEITQTLQYDTNLIWLVDIEFYIRLLQTTRKGAVIAKPLVLTHDAADQRLTSSILKDPELQVKEQAMLYEKLASTTSSLTRFFMQVYLARLFFKLRVKEKKMERFFLRTPRLLAIYFSVIRFKPLYFAYRIFIQLLDITRKFLF